MMYENGNNSIDFLVHSLSQIRKIWDITGEYGSKERNHRGFSTLISKIKVP